MRRTVLTTASAVLCLAIAGCSHSQGSAGHAPPASSASSSNAAPAAGGTLAVGPGPQSAYTVQQQPAPGSCHYRHTADGQPLPDPACTPGATSPAVTQATIKDTICRPGGYTSTIRPPASVTNREKAENARSYGYTGPMGDAEEDHLVPLSIGGDPNSSMNLWIEPPSPGHKPGAGPNNPKDAVESALHSSVCKGQVQLTAAQQAIASDWTTALARLGIKASGSSDTSDTSDGD